MKIILLLLFNVCLMYATSYDDEWPIYVYGDAQYYKLIFDAIAMIIQNHSFMDPVLGFVALASVLFIGKGFQQQNTSNVLWNTVASIGFITMLLYPSSTVHVLDVRTLHGYVQEDVNGTVGGDYSGYYKTDNIPFYLAASASFATSLKYYIIDISTDALSPIDGGAFRDSGFATPMTLAEDMISTASFKYSKDDTYVVPIFGQALSHYVEKCIIENALYVDQTQIHKVRDPKINQIEALAPTNFSTLAGTEINDLRGQPITCGNFWNNNIASSISGVKTEMQANLQLKHPKFNLSQMAMGMTFVAGLDSDAGVALTNMQNAMLNIASSAVTMNAFSKAGAGLSGIDLSNEMTAQQSLFMNMTDSTGQFKWMIRVVPVLEFLIFGILLFLAIPMAFVAGISGADKGGKMLMNYTFGLIAFSFIDVALAIVQAISLYYYKNKMADVVMALGQNPFTASGIPAYIQEMGYMSGMMGLAAVITVPIVVGVVFKGETAAAMGAYNSVMGKYKGDAGGQTASDLTKRAGSVHTSEAQQLEDAAKRELEGGYGITSIPEGALASQYLDQISAEAAVLSKASSFSPLTDEKYGGNFTEFAKDRARAGLGNGITSLTAELGTGLKNLELTNNDPNLSIGNQIESAKGNAEANLRKTVGAGLGAATAFANGAGDDFSYQVQTDSEASIRSQAAKSNLFGREAQIEAAVITANDGLLKSVKVAEALKKEGVFKEDGSAGDATKFAEYADALSTQSRMQTRKTMGVGEMSQSMSEKDLSALMAKVQDNSRVETEGGIKATHAEIMQHGSVNGAIADMITGGIEKGKGSATHAQNMRASYGNNLDGEFNGLSLSETLKTIDQSKIDSQAGQAKGVRENYAKNKDIYSQNAEFGEESKQQSTDAAIKAKGGMAAAVAVDVKAASIQAAEQAGNIGRKWDNIHDAKFLENQIAGLESAGADMSEFKGKTGLDYLKQMGASQAMKSMMKDSIVDANGKSVSFAAGKDGHVGMASIDGQTKIANGVNVDTGGQVAALAEGFNMTEAAIKDGHHVDVQNGKLVGNKASKEAFMKHIGNNQKNQAIVAGAPGEFLTVLQDLAEEFTPEVVADNFGKVAFAGVMGTMGYKLTSNAFGKKPSVKTNSETNGGTSDKSKDSVNHNNTSEHLDNIKNYTEDYQKSQESRDSEIKNASSLKSQRSKLISQDKDTSAIDEKIADSYERAKGHQENMNIADRNIKAEKYIASKNIDKEAMDRKNKNGGSSKAGWLSALAMPLVNELADVMGVDKSQSLVFSTIEAGSEIIDGGFTAALDVLKATGIGGFKALRGDGDAGQYFSKNMSSAASSVMSGFSNANETMATYAIMQEFDRQQAAPQHQGFATQPSGYHTTQAVSADMQQQAAQAQITMANNTQALSSIAPNSVTPQRSYVGFTMQDADQNPVSFTTDKTSRNMMVNGYDTGVQAQQFSSMMQNPDSVNQFANAISQTSFSNVEAYNATNNILSEMNAQSQRGMMQQKIYNNASDTNRTLQHKEALEINRQSKEKEDEF